jgi:hypothetical protein
MSPILCTSYRISIQILHFRTTCLFTPTIRKDTKGFAFKSGRWLAIANWLMDIHLQEIERTRSRKRFGSQ